MMVRYVAVVRFGGTRHHVAPVRAGRDGIGNIVPSTAQGLLPDFVTRPVELHDPKVRCKIVVIARNVAVVGFGGTHHHVAPVRTGCDGTGNICTSAAQGFLPGDGRNLSLPRQG